MINFPLYEMRKYESIFEEGGYKVIQTARNRYVLDCEHLDGVYAERRLSLLAEDLPYSLYPLSKRIETISQILECKHRTFIDRLGRIFQWKPSKFYKVECLPIVDRWLTSTGKCTIRVKGCMSKFVVSNGNYKYAQIVKVGKLEYLFELLNDKVPTTRKKI